MSDGNTHSILPQRLTACDAWSRSSGKSVDVLVSLERVEGFQIGCYHHELGKWQVVGFNGDWEVVEWWPLPEYGTGTIPKRPARD